MSIRRRNGEGALATRAKLSQAKRLRAEMTRAEWLLWQTLRGDALGVRTRRQHVILGWIVDFYVARARLVIEVDGPHHAACLDDDQRRDAALAAIGILTLRFASDDVERDPRAVAEAIAQHVAERRRGGGGEG